MSAEPDEVQNTPPKGPPPDALARMFESALDADASETPGARIGPYKLLEEIGEGGFGVVWMAEQVEPIRRRVALKIIKSGMDTREVIARFEAERQALALMDHPNIARVLDAGATDAGRPFFVMELVRGVPITRFCDEQRLSTEERLKLFISVCQAVQHAHQKGVIHRDLKPSNILVTMNDGVSVPKVIDFGIAKATSGTRLTEKTLFTRFHAFIGTPAYTSPEQMEMSSVDADTRSDIYSLGVLLYELLTGRPPFDADSLLKAGIEAMRRTICEVDPPRPSNRLTSLAVEDRTTVAQQRSTEPAKLSMLLRGDLDWIVMRCLEKDRNRRYETANGLARDIERHLVNEPVFARPPDGYYRLRKFIRRHKAGFAAVLAVLVSLVAGLVVSSILLVREQAASARAINAEQAESRLRQQAETGRELETKRASLTAIDLAEKLLEQGNASDAVAYLVHAAQKDPTNTMLAPRLASVLASRNFAIPLSRPFQTGARTVAMRYSADGATLLVATGDGILREIDSATGVLHRQTDLGKPVRPEGIVFAQDNDRVFAVRFADDTIALYEVGSNRPKWPAIQLDPKVVSAAGGWRMGAAIQISRDGRWISARGLRAFWLWDASNGENRMHLSFAQFATGPEFSPDSTRFVIATQDAVQTWSLPECAPLLEPMRVDRQPNNSGRRLIPSFSPDGKRLAVCDPWEGTEVFDTATGARLLDTQAGVSSMALSTGYLPDGRFFTSGRQGSLLWNLETGESMKIPAAMSVADRIVSSADGRLLLTTSDDGLVRVWDTATGALAVEPALHQSDQFCVTLSPDGTQLALGTSLGAIHRLRIHSAAARPLILPRSPRALAARFEGNAPTHIRWLAETGISEFDVVSGRELAAEPGAGGPQADAASADLDLRLVGSQNLTFNIRDDLKFVAVRRGRSEREVWELDGLRFVRRTALKDTGQSDRGVRFIFSPAGDLVAQVVERTICVWNLQTGELAGPPCGYRGLSLCAYPGFAFSKDGKRIAGGIENGEIVVWEVATGQPSCVMATGSGAASEMVCFSPDGTRLLNVNWWHEARLWDSANGKPLSAILHSADARWGDFSPDGRLFATWGPRSISFWDARTAEPAAKSIPSGADELQFTADGRQVVAAQEAEMVRVFDVETGQLIMEPVRANVERRAVFSADARFVLTEPWYGSFLIHSVPPLDAAIVPQWLLDLASACTARVIDDNERCVDAPNAVEKIDNVRRELASLPDDAPFVEWGRWILDASPTRSIAPGFTITPSEAKELEGRFQSSSQ